MNIFQRITQENADECKQLANVRLNDNRLPLSERISNFQRLMQLRNRWLQHKEEGF